MPCNEFIIYPGNLLQTQIEANIELEDGTTEELDLTAYDTINIQFKKTVNSPALISLTTEVGGGLTIDGNTILIDVEISDNVPPGNVIYDIECINEDGAVTYGPGEAKIVQKTTITTT